jgi:NTE family protein
MDRPILCIIHGGGCRQIEAATGMLKALDEAEIVINQYRGASAGAIAAALHASGIPGSRMEAIIRLTPVNRLFQRSAWNMLKLFIPGVKCDHIYNTTGLYAFLFHWMDAVRCLRRVLVSVTSYPEYETELLPATAESVLASAAIPEVFPPIKINGKLFVDGGVLNNVPTVRIADIDAYAHIYILLCPQDSSQKSRPWTKIGRCLQAVDETMDREVEEIKETWSALNNVTILQPPPYPSSLLSWSAGFGLIKHAYKYAQTELNK